MPNWCFGFMTIKGNKNDIKVFIDLLLNHDQRISNNKKRYFARSWNNDKDDIIKEYNNEEKSLTICTQHAWSFKTCMMEDGGYYQDYLKKIKEGKKLDYKLVCIEDICKELNLEIQAIYEEPGVSFTEEYWINNKGEIEFEEIKEIPEHLCYSCKHNEGCWCTEFDNIDTDCEEWPEGVISECNKYEE